MYGFYVGITKEIRMSTAVSSRQAGSKTMRKVKRAVEEQQGVGPGRLDATAAAAVAPGAPPQAGESQIDSVGGGPKSAFAGAPMRWTNPDGRDEDFRTLKALQASGMIGPDKLAGAREYSPAMSDYFQDKAAQQLDMQFKNLGKSPSIFRSRRTNGRL